VSLFQNLDDEKFEDNPILKYNRSFSFNDKKASLNEIADFVEDKNYVKTKQHEKRTNSLVS